jgi:hypothetical protein
MRKTEEEVEYGFVWLNEFIVEAKHYIDLFIFNLNGRRRDEISVRLIPDVYQR